MLFQIKLNLPEVVINSIGMKFILIKKSEFLMGANKTEEGIEENEVQHKVRITHNYYKY